MDNEGARTASERIDGRRRVRQRVLAYCLGPRRSQKSGYIEAMDCGDSRAAIMRIGRFSVGGKVNVKAGASVEAK